MIQPPLHNINDIQSPDSHHVLLALESRCKQRLPQEGYVLYLLIISLKPMLVNKSSRPYIVGPAL